jgi:hypothetical protein
VPGLYSETCHGVVQVMSVKVEEFTDVEEQEEPVPKTSPVIKTEHEVSCICMYIVIRISQISSIVKKDFILFHTVYRMSLPFCFSQVYTHTNIQCIFS